MNETSVTIWRTRHVTRCDSSTQRAMVHMCSFMMYEGATCILSLLPRPRHQQILGFWQVLFDRVYGWFVCTYSLHLTSVFFYFLTGICKQSRRHLHILRYDVSLHQFLSLTYMTLRLLDMTLSSSGNLGLSLINRCDSSVETFTAFALANIFSLNRSLATLSVLYISVFCLHILSCF